MSSARYVPTASEARRSNLITAGIVGVATPLLGWFEGFRDIFWLALFGAAMTLLTYGFYALLARSAGPAVIEVGETALVVERKGTRTEVPWSDIASVRFGSYGGENMAIKQRGTKSVLRVRLDGHGSQAVAEMRSRIEQRIRLRADDQGLLAG